MEQEARDVLGYLLAFRNEETRTTPQTIDPGECPNCGEPCASGRSPYCGEPCREEAAFVRQLRSAIALGWISEAQRQIALGQTLWHLLGGGYPLRKQILTEKAVTSVIRRDGGLCQSCGAPATTVDHRITACNRPINLRAVCEACCLDRPFGDPELLGRPTVQAFLLKLSARVAAPVPIQCCDDAQTWDWRQYLAKRAISLAPPPESADSDPASP